MNLHKLKERQDRINRNEFPLKCEEHNIKLEYDKKIKACKTEIKSIKTKISEEYRKTTVMKDNLNEYVYHIISLLFNKNNYTKEKEVIITSRNINNTLKKYQDYKNKLLLEDKEMFEDKIFKLIEYEDKREKGLINLGFEKIDFGIKNFHKLKDEFFQKDENKDSIRDLSNKFEKIINQNKKLKWDFNLIKIIYEKLLRMYKKEMNTYKILLNKLSNNNINNKRNKRYEEIKTDNINNNKKDKNNNLFTTRLISKGDRFNIFNNDNFKKENFKNTKLKINIENSTYSSYNTFNINKKCLSHENLNKNKIINDKIILNLKKGKINSKYFSRKKYLTIKTDKEFTNNKRIIKRIFSANSLTNKNINLNQINEEIYLKKVIVFMKQKNKEKDKCINKINLFISDEIKTLIWIKNFISKLINEIRYDIDDIKYYLSNDKDNKDLQNQLHQNEGLLFFCVYFYDNCIKGNNKTKYYFDYMNYKDSNKNNK